MPIDFREADAKNKAARNEAIEALKQKIRNNEPVIPGKFEYKEWVEEMAHHHQYSEYRPTGNFVESPSLVSEEFRLSQAESQELLNEAMKKGHNNSIRHLLTAHPNLKIETAALNKLLVDNKIKLELKVSDPLLKDETGEKIKREVALYAVGNEKKGGEFVRNVDKFEQNCHRHIDAVKPEEKSRGVVASLFAFIARIVNVFTGTGKKLEADKQKNAAEKTADYKDKIKGLRTALEPEKAPENDKGYNF